MSQKNRRCIFTGYSRFKGSWIKKKGGKSVLQRCMSVVSINYVGIFWPYLGTLFPVTQNVGVTAITILLQHFISWFLRTLSCWRKTKTTTDWLQFEGHFFGCLRLWNVKISLETGGRIFVISKHILKEWCFDIRAVCPNS